MQRLVEKILAGRKQKEGGKKAEKKKEEKGKRREERRETQKKQNHKNEKTKASPFPCKARRSPADIQRLTAENQAVG